MLNRINASSGLTSLRECSRECSPGNLYRTYKQSCEVFENRREVNKALDRIDGTWEVSNFNKHGREIELNKLINKIVEYKSDINEKAKGHYWERIKDCDLNRRAVLHLAALHGTPNNIQRILEKGGKVDITDRWGSTPLHLAVQYGRKETVKALLDNKANIHAKDGNGNTPLHLAARNGDLETVIALLNNGADIHARNKRGITPIILAARSGRVETVIALLNNGADIEGRDGWTALYEAVKGAGERDCGERVKPDSHEIVDLLLKEGVNPMSNATRGKGLNPLLSEAVKSGDKRVVEGLLEKLDSTEINRVDKDGSVLHIAAQKCHRNDFADIVELLLSNGANPKVKDKKGKTPLEVLPTNISPTWEEAQQAKSKVEKLLKEADTNKAQQAKASRASSFLRTSCSKALSAARPLEAKLSAVEGAINQMNKKLKLEKLEKRLNSWIKVEERAHNHWYWSNYRAYDPNKSEQAKASIIEAFIDERESLDFRDLRLMTTPTDRVFRLLPHLKSINF